MTKSIILLGGPFSGTIVDNLDDDSNGLLIECQERTYIYTFTGRLRIVTTDPGENGIISGGFTTIPLFEVDWRAMEQIGQFEMIFPTEKHEPGQEAR